MYMYILVVQVGTGTIYTYVPGSVECWYNGYDDGQANDFDQDRHKECIFSLEFEGIPNLGKPYYKAFIIGCTYVRGLQSMKCGYCNENN
jgi:hypothetical protein